MAEDAAEEAALEKTHREGPCLIDPEERAHKAYAYSPKGKRRRDFTANVIRIPKIRIVRLDGSGQREFNYVPDLDRTDAMKHWDLSIIQGYIAKMDDQVKPKDQARKFDLDGEPSEGLASA